MAETTTYLADINDLATLTGAAADNPKLLLALRRASDRFIDAIGWNPAYTPNDTIVMDGSGTRTLLLPVMHISAITSVTIADETTADYTANLNAGILRRASGWPDELGNITVTCSHGYEQIPGGLADAILEQAETQYRALAGIQSYALGGRSITFGAATTVGVTQKWSDAAARYSLGARA
ncbi:MAG: hypothetical protein LKI34_02850 [Bifidobacterium tibiigranuli]|jgi:hypothetical protein|uniref:hypothetical protein n=1 Tax=Bifidobacterium tibiigranuli TaxID=2172043 RepID=UPI0026F20329|nr:hypothetical protein [Bifidobacterium tibiigranuli]MCI1673145.1 hypothetical protein [Bifidobacterium tibiigranuli]MCI1713610.1 hypothetical protein [Bifidobacterium tibiigranuli]